MDSQKTQENEPHATEGKVSRTPSRHVSYVLARMKQWGEDFHRTIGEEWANFGTHFAGAVFGLFALTYMCVKTAETGDPRKIVSAAIYGTSLLVLYSCSALYHLVRRWRVKSVLQAFDHLSIYLLIAGSYTPFALVTLKDSPMGIWVLATTWILAIIGILTETCIRPRREWLALVITLAMGWEALFFFKPLTRLLDTPGFVMLLVGGGTLYRRSPILRHGQDAVYAHYLARIRPGSINMPLGGNTILRLLKDNSAGTRPRCGCLRCFMSLLGKDGRKKRSNNE